MHPVCRTLGLLSILALTSCHPSENRTTMNENQTAGAAIDPDAQPVEARFKENPAPRQAYRVTLDVAQAPGPFAVVDGFAQFTAPDCTYVINEAAGAVAHPEKIVPVAYTRVDDTTYAGTVYADAMLDEDYFGQGVCRWKLVVVSTELRATGAAGEARVFASLPGETLLAGGSHSTLHEKKRYPRDPGIADFSSLGLDPVSDDAFPLTLTSEPATP